MPKRSLDQIEESLRKKLAEADPFAGLGDKSPHRGDPIMSPDLGGGIGPGGAGGRVPGSSKPHYKIDPATKEPVLQNPKVWRRGEPPPAPMPKVWRRGEPPPAPMPATPQQQQAEKFLQGQGFNQPKTGLEKHIDYYNKAMPVDTFGGKVADALRGKSDEKLGPVGVAGRTEPTMSDTPGTNVGRKEPTLEQSKKEIDQSKTIENNLSEKYHGFKLHEAANVTKQDLLTMAKSAADRHGVPLPVVLHALYKETGWMKNAGAQVTARSPAGALGVMQLMPGTAKYLGLKPEEIFDPEKNIDAGVRYLSQNLQKFSDPRVALAAYNAGPNSKRVKQFAATGDTKYLPRETRKYVSDYADDTKVQLAKFYPEKKSVGKATDVVAALTASPTATAAEHPIGTIVNPDYSKYNVGDLGPLEKIGPGQYKSSTGKIVSNAPELEKLPGSPKPETFLDKVKRTLPQELGGGGELVSKVFGGNKKPTPVAKTEPPKTEPAKQEPVKAQPQIDVRKEFEKEFAKQRAALGPDEKFAWTNPVTGKTSEFTTAYKTEKPALDKITKPVEKPVEKPVVKEPEKDNIDYQATADRDRISKLVNQPNSTYDTDIKSSDTDSKKFTSSQEKWLGGADPTDPYILDRMNRSLPDEPAVEIPKLKEANASINTELRDILRLAGRI